MNDQLVTIFGGSGFVGRSIVREIARSGARIRVAVRRPEQAMVVKPMGNVGQIAPVQSNIRDEPSVEAAVAGADTVINLVGIMFEQGRQTFAAVHSEGAARVARAARAAGATRLVHFSAIGADPSSQSAFARSKAEGEKRVAEAFPGATIVRPSIIFGPDDDFFNLFAAMARYAPALPLIGGGSTRFQPVYVGDVADAVSAILHDASTAGKTYELGGPRVHSFGELMAIMLGEIGRRRLLLPVPYAIASLQAMAIELLCLPATMLGFMAAPPLTRDQVRMFRTDNIVSADALGLSDLGTAPTALEAILPTYLDRYRRGGVRAA